MDQVQNISIKDYTYTLPEQQIATYALKDRDHSRLLIWYKGEISDEHFYQLPDHLPSESMLVFNNTRVIRARLFFYKHTGAKIEIFCLEPLDPVEYTQSFAQTSSCKWKCIIGNLKKWKDEILVQTLEIKGKQVLFKAEKSIESDSNAYEIKFSWDNPLLTFAEILEFTGNIPIPPYLHRESEEIDLTSYQTVYSKIKGSVAAPTAGLHFTEAVLEALKKKKIDCEEVTLHVGAGTFQPVKTATIDQHHMHTEVISVHKSTIEHLIQKVGNIIAVGTTSVRTLESLYYIGLKLHLDPDCKEFHIPQWMPYETEETLSTVDALQTIVNYLKQNNLTTLLADTQILIKPGYTFHLIDGMITNFHQPKSTLLLLVSAFVDGHWTEIYDYAMANDFRFLSYGDSSLLLR